MLSSLPLEVRAVNKDLSAAVSLAEKERGVSTARALADRTALSQDCQILNQRLTELMKRQEMSDNQIRREHEQRTAVTSELFKV